MLHIFLVILKIIGILLAVIAGILLVLVLCILYCPLRYRMEGQYKDSWKFRAVLSFLGPLIRMTAWYEEDLHYRLRIAGIPILSGETLFSGTKKSADDPQKEEKTEKKDAGNREDLAQEPGTRENPHKAQESGEEETKYAGEEDSNAQDNDTSSGSAGSGQTEPGRIERVFDKAKSMYNHLIQSLKDLWAVLLHLKEVWEDEQARRGMNTIKKEIWFLLGKVKPRNIHWYLKIGLEDPADTGQLLGALAVFASLWNESFRVEPDFENKVFETEFSAKGLIQGFRLVRLARKGWFDQDIRYLLEKGKGLRRK